MRLLGHYNLLQAELFVIMETVEWLLISTIAGQSVTIYSNILLICTMQSNNITYKYDAKRSSCLSFKGLLSIGIMTAVKTGHGGRMDYHSNDFYHSCGNKGD